MRRLIFVLLALCCAALPAAAAAPVSDYDAQLVALAKSYQAEAFAESPSSATDAGIHTWDAQLAQYSAQAQADQFAKLLDFRSRLVALQPPAGASVHDRVDYLLLRSRMEGDWWQTAVLRGLQRNPTVYEGECANGIFSLIKKPFASADVRTRDAIARMLACPRVLTEGKANLTDTVREFAADGGGRRRRRRLALHVESRRDRARRHARDARRSARRANDRAERAARVRRVAAREYDDRSTKAAFRSAKSSTNGICTARCCCRSIPTTSRRSAASSWLATARWRHGRPIATRTSRRRRRSRLSPTKPRFSRRTSARSPS